LNSENETFAGSETTLVSDIIGEINCLSSSFVALLIGGGNAGKFSEGSGFGEVGVSGEVGVFGEVGVSGEVSEETLSMCSIVIKLSI